MVSICALFPGQGSQYVGMGKELFEHFTIARETFEEASDATRTDLKTLCFNGQESDLMLTENTQPCLLTVSVAAFRTAQKEFEFRPTAVAGHSLGEYSALVAAGALPLAKAAYWVKERGKAMQQAVPSGQGTMAAVMGATDEQVRALCQKAKANAGKRRATGENSEYTVDATVEPANYNAPGQIVIAGSTDAVQEALDLIKTDGDYSGVKAIPLQVSAPFHSTLMAPARERMAALFSETPPPSALSCPYVPNRTARLTREPGIVYELLVEQVDNPVLWRHSVTALLNEKFLNFAEFGPGKVLTGLNRRISQPLGVKANTLGIGDLDGVRAFETLLKGAK